jgi:hypothetical protein
MGKIIIGILFIIGGLSGEFVLRGTNSGGALAVLGVILIILGFVQISKSAGKGDVDYQLKPAGPKKPFSSVATPLQTINFKAYDINTKHYIGKILEVNIAEKTIKIKDDFGKELINKFDEIEILDDELNL